MSARRVSRTELGDALRRAERELPLGSAAERLRNYCGRVWDILRTHAGVSSESEAVSICFQVIEGLLLEGEYGREVRSSSRGAVTRVLVSSLFARARWCASPAGIDAGAIGECSRVVTETLEVLLPAIVRPRRGAATADESWEPSTRREGR